MEKIKDFSVLARGHYYYDFVEWDHGTKPGLIPVIAFFTISIKLPLMVIFTIRVCR